MSTPEPIAIERLAPSTRGSAAAVATVMLVLLGVARWLEPSPSGMETHRQLGLPECTFKWLVNRPCPSCGMTTSWAHLMRGRVDRAMAANAGGAALALVSLAVAPWLLISAIRGRWLAMAPSDRVIATIALAIAVITVLDWLRRLGPETWFPA